jgi:hypothetical protein
MNCLRWIIPALLIAAALFAGEPHETNGVKLPLITADEVLRHIGFFALKYQDKTTDFSKSPIAAKDIITLGGLTGKHRIT